MLTKQRAQIEETLRELDANTEDPDLQMKHLSLFGTATDNLPRHASDCILQFFALEQDIEQRLAFTSRLLTDIDPQRLNVTDLDISPYDPLYAAEHLQEMYDSTQLESAFIVEIERKIAAQSNTFIEDVAQHYNTYDYFDE